MFQTGETIGPYRVTGFAGSGGAGQVLTVEHSLTRRVEAMKVLLRGSNKESIDAQRFLREIQVHARLHHPNIAAVMNAFWAGDDLVMVMELVAGESLKAVLARGRLPVETAVSYGCQALSALSYAHAHGVMHRDVTPANMMITPQGTLKLTDFGLAKSAGDEPLTRNGTALGSMEYTSPEQVRARPDVDMRTDIYSLGAVLYEMVTGRKLFSGSSSFALMLGQVEQAPAPPIDLVPELPRKVNDVILRALAKNPEERFQSADEFRAALLAPAAVVVRRPGPLALGFGAAALVMLAAGSAAWMHVRARMRAPAPVLSLKRPATPAVPPEWAAVHPNDVAPEPEPTRPRQLGKAAASHPLVAAPAPRAALTPLPVELPRQRVPPPPAVAAPPVAAPLVKTAAPAGYRQTAKLTASGNIATVALSSSGRWLAAGLADNSAEIWDRARKHATLRGHSGPVTAAAFNADGTRLATASVDGAVKIWNVADGMERATYSTTGRLRSVAISSDGEWLAAGSSDNRLKLWSLKESGRMMDLRDHRREAQALVFSPAGGWLASASSEKQVRLWRTGEDHATAKLQAPEQGAAVLAFSHDGRILAGAGGDQLKLWQVEGQREIVQWRAPGRILEVAFMNDGRCLVFAQAPDGVRVFDVTKSSEVASPKLGAAPFAIAVTPDARRVATASGAAISVWEGEP